MKHHQRVKDEGGIHDPVLISEDDEILDGHWSEAELEQLLRIMDLNPWSLEKLSTRRHKKQ